MRAIKSHGESPGDLVILAISLVPLWWILGVDFFIYHVLAIFLAFKNPAIFKPRDTFHFLVLLLIGALLFSLTVAALLYDADPARIVAALNNISIIGVGYVFYGHVRRRIDKAPGYIDLVWRSGFIVACFFVAFALVLSFTVMRGSFAEVSVPTLFGLLTPKLPGLLGTYQRAYLVSADWFGGDTTPRLYLFTPFSTGSAAVAAITGYMGYAHLRNVKRWIRTLFLALILFSVALTLTRGAIAGLVLGFIVLAILRFGKPAMLVIIVALPLIATLLLFVVPYYFNQALEMRQGSSDTRMLVYRKSIEMVMDINPILGLGVKPRTEDTGVPIGSHSSFLSLMVRSGAVGFFIAIAAFVILPAKRLLLLLLAGRARRLGGAYRVTFGAIVGGYISCFSFLLLQDFDAYASIGVIIMVFFSTVMSLTAAMTGGPRHSDVLI